MTVVDVIPYNSGNKLGFNSRADRFFSEFEQGFIAEGFLLTDGTTGTSLIKFDFSLTNRRKIRTSDILRRR